MSNKGRIAICLVSFAWILAIAGIFLKIHADQLTFVFSFLILLSTGVLLALNWRDEYYLFFFLLIPLSLELEIGASGTNMFFPSELLTGLLAIMLLSSLLLTNHFELDIPFSFLLFLLLYIGGQAISLASSETLMVSLKSVLVKLSYCLVFFVIPFNLLRRDPANFFRIFFVFTFSLIPVVCFILWQHAGYNYSKDYSGTAANPFFKDHTLYSAVLCFVYPIIYQAIKEKTVPFGRAGSIAGWVMLFLFPVAVLLSYCRAAWLSVALMAGLAVLITLKVHTRVIAVAFISLAVLIGINGDELFWKMRLNKYDSNAKNADLEQQAKSITNIRSDESNAERLNRWSCALRMFQEKPLTGYGAGMFQFAYIPFQRSNEKTRISITDPYKIQVGRGGTAHNEFLLVLSETGVIGFIGFTGLCLLAFWKGLSFAIFGSGIKRAVVVAAILGLFGFCIHSFFNNFLDTDKAASLFWCSLAAIAAITSSKENGIWSR